MLYYARKSTEEEFGKDVFSHMKKISGGLIAPINTTKMSIYQVNNAAIFPRETVVVYASHASANGPVGFKDHDGASDFVANLHSVPALASIDRIAFWCCGLEPWVIAERATLNGLNTANNLIIKCEPAGSKFTLMEVPTRITLLERSSL